VWEGIKLLETSSDRIPIETASLRVFSNDQTLDRVLKYRYYLGVTRINHISDLDIFDIPIVSVTRPNVNIHQLSAAQGKGLTLLEATVSALMEAVERQAGESYPIDKTATLKEMGSDCIDPSIFGIDCSKDTVIDWVKGISLKASKNVYIPAAKVLFPYIPTVNAKEISSSTTNGLASGNTLLEATLHGLFEVIERHGIYEFLEGAPAKYLDLETLAPTEKRLVKSIEETGSRICILDLSEFSLLPTVFVSLLRNHPMSPSIMVAGQGCHRDFAIAIRRGITEAVQSHTVSLQGSREDLIRHHSNWDTPEESLKDMWEEAKENAKKVGISKFESTTSENKIISEHVEEVCELLRSAGYSDVIVTDVTNPEVKIPVVSVIVPGILDSTILEKPVEN
jgi:YcaO-like protein with predicted kinase domain